MTEARSGALRSGCRGQHAAHVRSHPVARGHRRGQAGRRDHPLRARAPRRRGARSPELTCRAAKRLLISDFQRTGWRGDDLDPLPEGTVLSRVNVGQRQRAESGRRERRSHRVTRGRGGARARVAGKRHRAPSAHPCRAGARRPAPPVRATSCSIATAWSPCRSIPRASGRRARAAWCGSIPSIRSRSTTSIVSWQAASVHSACC